MIVILMQTADRNGLSDFISEPFGVLLFGIVLIGFAVSLRWFFKWNEKMTQRAQNISKELLEKTVG
jgi:hypothetical protein